MTTTGDQQGGQLELAIVEARRDRAVKAEFYQTQAWVLDVLLYGGGPELPGGIWLDPCAGYAAFQRAINRQRADHLARWTLTQSN